MSRLAVKTALQRVLVAVINPVEVDVYIQIPRFTADNSHAVLIMTVPDSHEIRLTLRGLVQSQKKMTYSVQFHISWVYDSLEEGGAMFDTLLDRVDHALRQYQKKMPEVLTDPEDGSQSQLVYVSENISTRTEDPQFDENEGMGLVKFAALKQVSVEEWISE